MRVRRLYVTAEEYRGLRKIYDARDGIGPSTPEQLAARDAAIRALLGPVPDGEYVLEVDWKRTIPFDRINRSVVTEEVE